MRTMFASLLFLLAPGLVFADQTLTSELIKLNADDTIVCDAANVGQRAVDATVAIIVAPPVGATIDPSISATFCEASVLASNFVCSHTTTATGDTFVPGARAYCQVVVAGPTSKVRATLRNETTGEKSDAR
ncbi:MAG TPA: hypothetical protein VMS64_32655 [Candidatus Methylomirabilis sp.]|nr:hypothetical protein [Candidatus Methylomirabilis sp.]